jgi:hypothetical protein
VKPVPSLLADAVDRLNRELEDPNERWKTFYFPVSTSSTEVIVDTVGCVGTCVETWMGFAEARRVAMQRRVVFHLLDAIGMMPLHGSLTA